jgi:hypothetical protein
MKLNITDAIQHAINDPAFAEELRKKAEAFGKGGLGSKEHKELLSHFASSPRELEEFSFSETTTLGATTVTTTTTYTTGACTTTSTTTTTTGN